MCLSSSCTIQWRLGDVEVAIAEKPGHVAEEEGEQQRAYVRAIHIGIGHQDDAVVAEPGSVKVIIDAGTQGGDENSNLLAGEHLVRRCLFHIQNLTA